MRLAFDDAGRGDGVVLIHGHPFDRGLWGPQVTGLRDRFRVVTPDLRGFGGSPVTPHLVTMDTYAADIVELLDELRISQAAIVGLSGPTRSSGTGHAVLTSDDADIAMVNSGLVLVHV